MSDLMAAIGKQQLKRLPDFASKRQLLSRFYVEQLVCCEELTLLELDYDSVVPHIFVVIVSDRDTATSLKLYLGERGIQTGSHYKPNHHLSFYRESAVIPLPNTERVDGRLVTLPLHPDLRDQDVTFICDSVKEFFRNK